MTIASNERNISGLRCIIIYLRRANKINSLALFIFIGTFKQNILINLHLDKKRILSLKFNLINYPHHYIFKFNCKLYFAKPFN